MLPVFQSLLGKRVMRRHRSNHAYGVHFCGTKKFIFVCCERNGRINPSKALTCVRTFVTDQDNFRLLLGMKIPDNIRSPIPISENADANHSSPDSCGHDSLNANQGTASAHAFSSSSFKNRVKLTNCIYFAWKLTRIKLLPMRNSAPLVSMAARTRSSSKKVPLVESMSFRLM